jgi:RNA polymerase sigma-70 factor (ECF subfamily)
MGSDAALQLMPALVDPVAVTEKGCEAPESSGTEAVQNDFNTLSDEQLLEAVTKGSKDALGLLFRLHGRAVFNVAWRILRDNSEADDLRQDVFLYVFERAKLFDAGKGSASSWIMQVAYHRAIDRRRYLVSRQHYDAHQFDEQQTQSGAAPSLSDAIDGKAILSRLRGELSAEQRETLELHFFEGYSLREIAEKSGQSVGNVRHHYYRALERLRLHLFPQKRP